MVSRAEILKIICMIVSYLVLLNCARCSSDNCYEIHANQRLALDRHVPIVLDAGIVGFIEEVKSSTDGGSLVKFCLPSDVQIPRKSKVYIGFIRNFGVYGVYIVSSDESEFINGEEQLQGVLMDTIELNRPPVDTLLRNKLIDIVKGINEHRKKKN